MRRAGKVARVAAAVAVIAAGITVTTRLPDVGAASGPFGCSAAFKIDRTLASGARWQMCWEEREIEGIVLHDVTYTPPDRSPVLVLARASLAQVHVPYDDNGARFHDETDFGLGGISLQDLDAADCPGGTLIRNGSKDVLCLKISPRGYEYKAYDDVAQGSQVDIHSVSAIGAYNYIASWHFQDDGAIRPEIGAAGTLQRFGGTPATGWPLGGGRIGVAHFHNFYWRLDVDLRGPAGDSFERLAATPNAARDQWSNSRTAITAEAAARVDPGLQRTWRVVNNTTNLDGHNISYELIPSNPNLFRGPAYEPFTRNEVYVTVNRTCERHVSHNPTTGGCGDDVNDFVNGQSLAGADLVVWYGTSFHHLPRDEDEAHMHAHWSSFTLAPRDLTAVNPIP